MFVDSVVFLLVIVTQVLFYVVATKELHTDWVRRMRYLPFFPLIGVGLAVNNARGVLEAPHRPAHRVRAPRRSWAVLGQDRALVKKREKTYTGGRDFWQAVIELALGAWYIWMAIVHAREGMVMPAVVTGVLSVGLFHHGRRHAACPAHPAAPPQRERAAQQAPVAVEA